MRHTTFAAALLLVACATLTGCNNPETWKFREEVVLNTGESVLVDRVALRNNVWPSLGGGGYQSVVNQWLSGSVVQAQWEQERYGGRLAAIGRVQGKIYLASIDLPPNVRPDLTYCQNHPDHYVAAFWTQAPGGWVRAPQSRELLDQLTANLLTDLEWGDDKSAKVALLTLREKSRRAKQSFEPPLSLRQAFDARYGTSCRTALALANWKPASSASQPR